MVEYICMHEVVEAVVRASDIGRLILKGESRKQTVVRWRQTVFAVALDSGMSTTKTGKAFNRDHSTVIHGARAHRRLLASGDTGASYRQNAIVAHLRTLVARRGPLITEDPKVIVAEPATTQSADRQACDVDAEARFAVAMLTAHPELVATYVAATRRAAR